MVKVVAAGPHSHARTPTSPTQTRCEQRCRNSTRKSHNHSGSHNAPTPTLHIIWRPLTSTWKLKSTPIARGTPPARNPPRPPPGLCVTTVGALVGGVKVRTSPGLLAPVGLPPGVGSAPPGPARILASRSATEGPAEVLTALDGVEVGAGGSSRGEIEDGRS